MCPRRGYDGKLEGVGVVGCETQSTVHLETVKCSRKERSFIGKRVDIGTILDWILVRVLCMYVDVDVHMYILIIKRQLMIPELKDVAFLEAEFCLVVSPLSHRARLP